MSALRRRPGCLVLLVAGLAVLVAGVVLVRRALDPEALRVRAEERLSEVLGQPVTIGRMNLSWLPAPVVEASDIRIGGVSPGAAPAPLALRALRITPRLSSLFSTPVVIDRVEVLGLAVRIGRDAQGRWLLPVPASHGGGAAGGARAVDVEEIALQDGRVTIASGAAPGSAGLQAATIEELAATLRWTGGEMVVESLRGTLGRSSIEGQGRVTTDGIRFSLAWLSLSAHDLPQAFALVGTTAPEGLAIEGDTPLVLDVAVDRAGVVTATGRVAARRGSFKTLSLVDLAAPLRYANGHLVLEPVRFEAYNGTHTGRLTVNTVARPVEWSLESDLQGVDIRELVSANTSAKGAIEGTGRVRGNIRGTALAPLLPQVRGRVVTEVGHGVIHDFPILAAVNAALRLGAGDERDLRFDTLFATWTVGNAQATTDDFVARSGELRLAAAGRVGFDQALDFRGRLAFSQAKSQELIRRVRELSGLRNSEGEIEVPVAITGRIGAPSFAIDTRAMLGKAIEDELKRRLRKGLGAIIK